MKRDNNAKQKKIQMNMVKNSVFDVTKTGIL
jgi:hypothetical protein